MRRKTKPAPKPVRAWAIVDRSNVLTPLCYSVPQPWFKEIEGPVERAIPVTIYPRDSGPEARVRELEAEVRRLRRALREFRDRMPNSWATAPAGSALGIARAALARRRRGR